MNICSTLIANRQTSHLVQPAQTAFNYPTVFTQLLATFDALSRNSTFNLSAIQNVPDPKSIVSFICMKFLRLFARSPNLSTNRRNRIQHGLQHLYVVDICWSDLNRQRNTISVGNQVPFGSWFSSICWVGAYLVPPFLAGTVALSRHARSQSISPAILRRLRRTRWSLSQTPAACQSRNLRQQVIPLPQPISMGKYSHGRPVRSTNNMPVRAALSDTLGRPPLGLGGSGGSNGSIISQSSSGKIGLAMPRFYYKIRVLLGALRQVPLFSRLMDRRRIAGIEINVVDLSLRFCL